MKVTKREKPKSAIKSWEDANEALRQIGSIETGLERIEAAMQDRINDYKKRAEDQAAPLLREKAALELGIKEFAGERKREFADVRSRQMLFGSVGFRKSTKITYRKAAAVVEKLKELGLMNCVKVKESPDKDAMKKLPDARLQQVGAKRKSSDDFWYEVDRDNVKEAG